MSGGSSAAFSQARKMALAAVIMIKWGQNRSRTVSSLYADKCWVGEDILAWLALSKSKTKLFEIVFIVGEPV